MVKKLKFKSLLFLSAFLFISCASIKIPHYEVNKVIESQNSVKIIQISDFHGNAFGKNEEKLIEKIRDAQPDLIFITGDLFEFKFKDKGLENVKLLLEGIRGICPFYFVSGNHEYYYGHNNEYTWMIEEYGGIVLDNKIETTIINGIDFVIAGVDDPISYIPVETRERDGHDDEQFFVAIENISKQAANLNGDFYILLAHRPEYIDKYKESGVFDLILSGHAHGGQWRFPPFINGLYAPGQGLFPKYAGGRYDFEMNNKSSTFIVSRGLSHQEPFFPRFFNRVELVEINVQSVIADSDDLVQTE